MFNPKKNKLDYMKFNLIISVIKADSIFYVKVHVVV